MTLVSLLDFFYSGVNIESCSSTLWNWITNILRSYSVNEDSVWISILWFGLYFWTNFESRLDLSHNPESVFVPVPFEPKLIIFHNHTSLLERMLNKMTQNLFLKIENWMGVIFFNKIIHFSNILLGRIREVTGGFLQDPWYLDWVATLGPVKPPPESLPWGNLPSLSICFMYIHIHDALRKCMR